MAESTHDEHFVAVLKIEHINRRITNAAGRPFDEPKREIAEVTHMTIKAKSLDDLKSRLGAHINLVEAD